MLEASIYGAYPRGFLSDSAHRCRRCSGGPVMGSDGFLMDHCMNCGNWQGVVEPLSLGLGTAKRQIVRLLRKATARFRRLANAESENAVPMEAIPAPCT